MVLTTLTDL